MSRFVVRFILIVILSFGIQLFAYCEDEISVRCHALNIEQFGKFNKLIEEKEAGLSGISWSDILKLLKQAGLSRSELLALGEVDVTPCEMKQINSVYSNPMYGNFEKKYSNYFFVKCTGKLELVCIMTNGNGKLKDKKRETTHVRDKYGRIWCVFNDSIKQ